MTPELSSSLRASATLKAEVCAVFANFSQPPCAYADRWGH